MRLLNSFACLLGAVALAFAPALATAQRITVPAVAGSPQNPQNVTETLAFGDGSGTALTYSGTVNTKNATWQTLAGPTSSAWSSFCLYVWAGASTSAKYLIDFSIDGGSTLLIEDFYAMPNASGGAARRCLLLNVPAGSTFSYKYQTSTSSGSIRVALEGTVRNAAHPPNFTRLANINGVSAADSRIDATNVPLNGTWTSLGTTGATYGGIYADVGDNGSGATTAAKSITVSVGTGSGTPTTIMRFPAVMFTGNPILYLTPSSQTIKTVASGTEIQARVDTTTADSDNVRVGVWGYVP